MDIAGALGGRMGPLPGWAWIAGGGGAIGTVALILKSRKANAPAAQNAPVVANPFAFGNPTTDPAPAVTTPAPTPITGGIEPYFTHPSTISGPQSAPMSFPYCKDAPAGQPCTLQFIDSGGVLFETSRPDIGQVPAGSSLWATLARDWSYQIGMMPGFQLQPGGIKYFGSPNALPPGTPYYGFPGVGATMPNQQR